MKEPQPQKKGTGKGIVIALVIAVAIFSCIVYYFFVPKPYAFKMKIDLTSVGFGVTVPFQNQMYHQGGLTQIIDNPNVHFPINFRRGDLITVKLDSSPLSASPLWYNYILLEGDVSQGYVDCKQISIVQELSFTIPKDGYYDLHFGVLDTNLYNLTNSVGIWTFTVTVTPP